MLRIMPISSSSTAARQAERRDVRAHQPAGRRELLEDHDLVAERRQIVGDRQRRRAGADAARRACRSSRSGALGRRSVMSSRRSAATRLRRQIATGLLVDARAPAGRLARAIAGAPEDAREHVRLAVEHVRVGVAALGDEPDVLGDVGVRRAGPLAIDDLVEVIGITDVGWFHRGSPVPRIHHICSAFQVIDRAARGARTGKIARAHHAGRAGRRSDGGPYIPCPLDRSARGPTLGKGRP